MVVVFYSAHSDFNFFYGFSVHPKNILIVNLQCQICLTKRPKTMKTIIIITIIFCLFCSSLLGQTKNLDADIRGRSCIGGSGVCSTIQGRSNTNNMKTFTITKQSATLFTMEIDINNLSIEEQKTCFGKEYSKIAPTDVIEFIQDQDFIFDINTLLYLELDPAFRMLKRGMYPLEIINGKARVTLTLSQYQ